MPGERIASGVIGVRHDGRAVTPTVGKVLEIGLALLVVTGLVTGLYGGVVPSYRTDAGGEVAERVAVGAAERIEAAVPPESRWSHVERRLPLPTTIRGEQYRLVADDRRLRLDHPTPGVAATVSLGVPERVASVSGSVDSGATAVVVIRPDDSGLLVRLRGRDGATAGGAA